MDITSLVDRCLKDSIDKYGKDDPTVKLSRDIMTFFGYKVLGEINRLNFPAFTILDSFEVTKQGFVNVLLNYMVDKDDPKYGKIHFTENKLWQENCTPACTSSHWLVVKLEDDKLDFAKYSTKTEKWTSQNDEVLTNVKAWAEFERQEL